MLHLNDAEPFPARLKEGFFKKGDVMVSLRNINTVFVFNRESEKIKFIITGMFARQHDPNFIDGNTFSVFDNNTSGFDERDPQSRILIVNAPERTVTTVYQGTPEKPFYTVIEGRQQWLPNGNLLITVVVRGQSVRGRSERRDRLAVHQLRRRGSRRPRRASAASVA